VCVCVCACVCVCVCVCVDRSMLLKVCIECVLYRMCSGIMLLKVCKEYVLYRVCCGGATGSAPHYHAEFLTLSSEGYQSQKRVSVHSAPVRVCPTFVGMRA